jgi:hypothetical protein
MKTKFRLFFSVTAKVSPMILCITNDTFLDKFSARLSSAFQEFLLKGFPKTGISGFQVLPKLRVCMPETK